MNAIPNARLEQAAATADAGARSRRGAPDPGAGESFEKMLTPRPDAARGDGNESQPEASPGGADRAVAAALPQAIAELLRSALQTSADGGENSDVEQHEAKDGPGMDAPAALAVQAFAPFAQQLASPERKSSAEPGTWSTFAPAPPSDGPDGDVTTRNPETDAGPSHPERSSIMSSLDNALQATRQNPSRGRGGADAHAGEASASLATVAEAEADPSAADDGVKVSFVSMSRSPAPAAVPGEAVAAQRTQAATPPAPPPPLASPTHHLRLIMEPSGMGAVALSLSLSDSQVSVDLEAQRSETRHALEANRDKLVDSLTGAGYDVAHVQVKTASIEPGFNPTRGESAMGDAPAERAQQDREERPRDRRDHEARNGDHADDPRARAHRSGGVFL